MPWPVRLRHVGTGSGQLGGSDLVVGRSRRDRVGERESQLVEEFRVGCREMEGDRVRGVVGDDPAGEVAVSGRPFALAGADQAGVEGGRADAAVVDAEDSLDCAAKVLGPAPPHRLST